MDEWVMDDGQALLMSMSIKGEVEEAEAASLIAARVFAFGSELVLVKMLFVSFSTVWEEKYGSEKPCNIGGTSDKEI